MVEKLTSDDKVTLVAYAGSAGLVYQLPRKR